MKANLAEVTERRAINLALLYLTRGTNLVVHEGVPYREGKLFDLIVGVVSDNNQMQGYFAVEVKGSYDISEADALVASAHLEALKQVDVTIPLCYIYFTMNDDKGYYTWLRRPISARTDGAQNGIDTSHALLPLTDASLEEIANEVTNWYRHDEINGEYFSHDTDGKHLLQLLLAAGAR